MLSNAPSPQAYVVYTTLHPDQWAAFCRKSWVQNNEWMIILQVKYQTVLHGAKKDFAYCEQSETGLQSL